MAKKTYEAMNDHITLEFYSAFLYLAMSAYFEDKNLPGFARWSLGQYHEELEHGMKFFHFLNSVNHRVKLDATPKPTVDFPSPPAAFEAALKHERHVTSRIHSLVAQATKENNHPAFEFLQWFVKEQVEEEKTVHDIVQRLKHAKDSKAGLLLIDQELGRRDGAPS